MKSSEEFARQCINIARQLMIPGASRSGAMSNSCSAHSNAISKFLIGSSFFKLLKSILSGLKAIEDFINSLNRWIFYLPCQRMLGCIKDSAYVLYNLFTWTLIQIWFQNKIIYQQKFTFVIRANRLYMNHYFNYSLVSVEQRCEG